MIGHVVRATRRLFCLNSCPSLDGRLLLHQQPSRYQCQHFGHEMAPLFAKRITCFYCGRRSAQTEKGPIRKWRCSACEAINYLDEVGLFLFSFLFRVSERRANHLGNYDRKDQSRTPQQQIQILIPTDPMYQVPLSSRLILRDPVYSARNVSEISIFSQVLSPHISHQQTIQTMAHTNKNIRSFVRTLKNGTRKYAPNVSLG